MKILHLNTHDSGGGFHAMARLHLALCELGIESSATTRKTPISKWERIVRRFDTWLTEKNNNVFSPVTSPQKTPISKLSGTTPDIVHLHWVSRWIDLPSLIKSIPMGTPIFWTIHDFGAFTGGCHLHSGCEGFAHGCTHCPIVRAPFNNAIPLPARELARKRQLLQNRPISIIGNSHWTSGYAQRSQAFPEDTQFDTIHPGFEPNHFLKIDPITARSRFHLTNDLPVIGFGCASLSDENKRFDLFLKTAALIAKKIPKIQLLVFGDHHDLPEAPAGTTLHHAGSLTSPSDLSAAYSAMDLFLVTSRVETFGQVSIEAQACGTPVAIFDAGGLAETLSPGNTGTISPNGDINHLAIEVIQLLEDKQRLRAYGENAATWARSQFSTADAAAAHAALYKAALQR